MARRLSRRRNSRNSSRFAARLRLPLCLEVLESRRVLASETEFRGHVFYDQNEDRLLNSGEAALEGWVVYLDLDENGFRGLNEPAAVSQLDGSYSLRGNFAGTFILREELRTGWANTTPADGHRLGVTVGDVRENLDFGNVVTDSVLLGRIEGTVWNDVNRNGSFDSDENGLSNWQLFLDANANGTLDIGEIWTFSGPDGNYHFSQIPPVTHRVMQVVEPGWEATYPISNEYLISLSEGEVRSRVDFGNVLSAPGELRGTKWSDSNGNGQRDPDEVGLQGVRVFLDDNLNGFWDLHEQGTITDSNGDYVIPGVAPGQHLLSEFIGPKWRQNSPGVQHGFAPGPLEKLPFGLPGADAISAPPLVASWIGSLLPDPARFDSASGWLAIAENLGGGRFLPPLRVDLGEGVEIVLPTDWDNDLDTDIVAIANLRVGPQSIPRAQIVVWLNQGSGIFVPGSASTLDGIIQTATLSEWNGDSSPDLFLTRQLTPGGLLSHPELLQGRSDGSFEIITEAVLREALRGSIIVHDFNADDFPDLAIVNTGQHELLMQWNRGDGTFADGVSFGVGFRPTFASAGDLDGDGDLDLVVSNESGNDLSILRNLGDGIFDTERRLGPVNSPRASAMLDLDRDQDLDLVVVSGFSGSITRFLNNGSGEFGSPAAIAVGSLPRELILGDWDRDQDLDLALTFAGSNSVAILENLGTGHLSVDSTVSAGARVDGLSAVYVNDDFFLDLIVSSSGLSGQEPAVSTFLNRGDGTFAPRTSISSRLPDRTGTADFDHDGTVDLFAYNLYQDFVSIWSQNANGTFEAESQFHLGMAPDWIRAIDMTSDELPDLLVQHDGQLSLFVNSGGTTFGLSQSISLPQAASDVQVADLDEDGILDLLVVSALSEIVSLLSGHGDGTFESPEVITVPSMAGVSIEDIDGDQHLDLILLLSSGQLGTIRNQVDPAYRHRVDVGLGELVLSADFGNQRLRWTNPVDPLDVDGSGRVAPLDALLVINYINHFGSGPLPDELAFQVPYYDAAGGDDIVPLDALVIINRLNNLGPPVGGGGGGGEGASGEGSGEGSGEDGGEGEPTFDARGWLGVSGLGIAVGNRSQLHAGRLTDRVLREFEACSASDRCVAFSAGDDLLGLKSAELGQPAIECVGSTESLDDTLQQLDDWLLEFALDIDRFR